jgi:hypothetical protein
MSKNSNPKKLLKKIVKYKILSFHFAGLRNPNSPRGTWHCFLCQNRCKSCIIILGSKWNIVSYFVPKGNFCFKKIHCEKSVKNIMVTTQFHYFSKIKALCSRWFFLSPFSKTFFHILFLDIYKCPKTQIQKNFWKK